LEEWKREMRGRGGRCWGVVWVGIIGGMGDVGIRGEMWDIRYEVGGVESVGCGNGLDVRWEV